jgi:hypothetical protein
MKIPLGLFTFHSAMTCSPSDFAVDAWVGVTVDGIGGVAAGVQAASIILTSIKTETSNLRVFIFSPLVIG